MSLKMGPSEDEIEAFEKYFVHVVYDSQYKGDLLENLRKKLTELESKETQYDKLDEEFKAELKEAKETSAEMTRINLAWTEEKQGLNEELGKIQVTHNMLWKINDHFKAKNNQIKSEIGLLETEKKQLELNLCTKEIKKLTLKTKLIHLKTDLNNVTRQMEANDRHMKELKNMCGELETEVKTHELDIEEVIDEYKTADDDVKRVMEEIENMKKTADELEKDVEQDHIDVTVINIDNGADENNEQSLMNQLVEMRTEEAKILQEIIQLMEI